MKMSSITGKRGSTESPATGGGGSEKKRAKVEFDFDSKLVATSEEELNIGLLRIQNRKLFERLRQRKRVEDDLRSRIDQLEKKQLTDDTKLYVINRYWNQLNEDIRLIIQRFDNDNSSLTNATTATTTTTTNADSNEDSNESATSGLNEETSSFVRQLANCDKEELDEVMQQRVQLSTRAVEKVLLVLDRIAQRNEKLYAAIKGSADEAKEEHEADSTDESDPESSSIKSPKSPSPEGGDRHRKRRRNRRSYPPMNLDETVRGLNVELTAENKNLNGLVTSLHERHHVMSLKYAELKDKVDAKELAVDELKNRIDELEMELNKSRTREKRLEEHFYDAREKLRDLQNNGGGAGAGASGSGDSANSKADSGLSSGRVEELKREIEEQRELAQSRLAELEALNNEHKETLKLMEKYKLDLQCIPDLVIRESAEYKSLQSHFSVLFNESVLLKNQVDEIRAQLASAKNAHLRQMEHMESEELCMQKKLRTELMQIEDRLAQRNKEYDMLRLEFEQTLAANEQTGPINREMRHLITSLQTHTQQLKGENARTKKKLKEANVEIARLKVIIEQNGLKVCSGGLLLPDPKVEGVAGAGHLLPPSSNEVKPVADLMSDSSNDGILVMASEGDVIKNELKSEPSTTPPQQPQHPSSATTPIKKDSPGLELIVEPAELAMFYEQGPTVPLSEPTPPGTVRSVAELEKTIRELKAQLKKSAEAQRELKLLLDAYKMADKEKRDKAQLMVTEKKLRQEIEELRNQIKKHQEAERRGDRRKLTDEEYARKIAKYEEVIGQLQKSVTSSKQEEEALLNEMEVTGQAFEDMQEQNDRLLQQLREKDDANFKLMSERIKSNQIQKMLKDEKDMLTDQVIAINNQLEAQNAVVRKLEEKERILQANVTSMENEVKARINYVEALKRKAIESSQATNDLKLHLDKYVTQIRDAQSIVADKTSAWQQETFKTKRLVEELQMYKRKYERAKKFEIASTADEVLQEEIRELKEELTCPSCKTKRKDAVLNKCFHVFCYDCLKTRYETRQRKCPKCNQSFSANDFHRLYLA